MVRSKKESAHDTIVHRFLPKCAERLKSEGLISAYCVDKKRFEISPVKDSDPITIRPDLVFSMPDRSNIAVEVANPKDPKRFIGELISPHFLVPSAGVDAAIVLVLPCEGVGKVHKSYNRPVVQDITLGINIISSPKIGVIHLDTLNQERICNVLLNSLKDYRQNRKFG